MAIVSASGALEQSTEPFRERCDEFLDALAADARLLRVLHGQLDHTTLAFDGIELDVEAVLDLQGKRRALLIERTPDGDGPSALMANALLDERFDSSPAIVWLKDMDGRYLHANSRYEELLSTSEDQLIGRTDEELPAREVVDGPRLRRRIASPTEPLQLEYTIEPFEGRPALAVLRFAVLDRLGDPVAVCGVASPLRQAHVARAECARIVRMERWSRLDREAVTKEILDEWGVVGDAPPPEPSFIGAHDDDPERENLLAECQAAQAERDVAIDEARAKTSEIEQLKAALSETRSQTAELAQLRQQRDEASARAEKAERELASQRAEASKLREELAAARAAQEPAPVPAAAPSAPAVALSAPAPSAAPPSVPAPSAAPPRPQPSPAYSPPVPPAPSAARRGGLLKMFGSRRKPRGA